MDETRDKQVEAIRQELEALEARKRELSEQLRSLLEGQAIEPQATSTEIHSTTPRITKHSSPAEKLALFRSLFRGRDDVYARRWENSKTGQSGYQPACKNEWVQGLCDKRHTKCNQCPHRELMPVADSVIASHLRGMDLDKVSSEGRQRQFIVGIYPLLLDETCWFLAVDFDKTTWQDDASAYLDTCRIFGVPAALERSRSGNGGHVWVFFESPVPAALARKLASYLLTETMEYRPEIGLDSYDRLYPSQDTMPQGGFGNLIALPLQKHAREKGNSLFLDESLTPHEDQLAYLSSVRRMSREDIVAILGDADQEGRILGVRMVVEDEYSEDPWTLPPSRQRDEPPITGDLPSTIQLVLANQVYIPKDGLPKALINRLVRLAAFQNPEFYKNQAMHLSTFGKPRIISCAEDFPKHIGLPRGCLDDVTTLLQSIGVEFTVEDERHVGTTIEVAFQGILRPEQGIAAEAMLAHDTGVLAATTAFGKTVVAAYLISKRKANTLVLVHRRQLLDQWIERLTTFLGIERSSIGQIGAGKNKPTGFIDVALIQSLCRKGVVKDVVAQYGHVVVDECHHLSAISFESVARECKARYLTGLSATPTRKDGHHPIIFMQCGPIRYRVDARKQAAIRPFEHRVLVRRTPFKLPSSMSSDKPSIHDIYDALIADEQRNCMIIDDVITAVEERRSPVIITERKEHMVMLATELSKAVRNVIVLQGGMGIKQRRAIQEKLASIPDDEERVIVATGKYLGEGFDDARLDSLYLAMPISWRGTLAQYAGRIHRMHDSKTEVRIYDYADLDVPMLARMHQKRLAGYKTLGYTVGSKDVGNDIKRASTLAL